jgi:hypothetical protein
MKSWRTFLITFSVCTISVMLNAQVVDRIKMVYQETVCPPSWISYENTDQTFNNLKKLLLKDSVKLYSLRYDGIPYEMTCAGCGCLTGRNIEITIDRNNRTKVEAYHFYRPWKWMVKSERICDWTMGLFDDEINDSLMKKGIRLQGLYCTGLSEKKSTNCVITSGRDITIRIDKDDIEKAKSEGFVENKEFKQY